MASYGYSLQKMQTVIQLLIALPDKQIAHCVH